MRRALSYSMTLSQRSVGAASGTISSEESAVVNQIANELKLDTDVVAAIRAEFHERLSSVQEVRRVAGEG